MSTEPDHPGSNERPSFRDKIRSINFGQARHRAPKVTTDHHDTHKVDVTEHWEDRQDVTVRPDTLRMKLGRDET